MNPAYISAVSMLCGSGIGALASIATTPLSQRHEDEIRRRTQEHARRELIFVDRLKTAKPFIYRATYSYRIDPVKFPD